MKFASIYVATSRGEADPCGEAQVFNVSSLDHALEYIKNQNLDEVVNSLEPGESLTELDTEFFEMTGKVGELGWVECGEEGMNVIAPETSKWFKLFNEVKVEGADWDDKTWKEFEKIIENSSL